MKEFVIKSSLNFWVTNRASLVDMDVYIHKKNGKQSYLLVEKKQNALRKLDGVDITNKRYKKIQLMNNCFLYQFDEVDWLKNYSFEDYKKELKFNYIKNYYGEEVSSSNASYYVSDNKYGIKVSNYTNKIELDNLIKEAMLLLKLSNIKNIPKFYHYGFNEKEFYLIQEHVSGISLEEYVNNNQLSFDETLMIMQQLVNILNNIRKFNRNFNHRDIKPQNIIVKNNDIKNLYLIDFGLSVQYGGSVEGSKFFRAPEQAKIGITNLSKVDVYSLGVLWLYLNDSIGFENVRLKSQKNFLIFTQSLVINEVAKNIIMNCLASEELRIDFVTLYDLINNFYLITEKSI